MTERILFISGNAEWRESLVIAVDRENETSHADLRWREIAGTFHPTIAVLNADNPRAGLSTEGRERYCAEVIDGLWKISPDLPLLVVTAVPSRHLADLSPVGRPVDILLDLDADPFQLVDRILEHATRLRSSSQPGPALGCCTVEVTLGEAHIECEVRLGGQVERFGPVEWNRRDLAQVNEDFQRYESDDALFATRVDRALIEATSERLLWHAFEAPLDKARTYWEKGLTKADTIYYRFNITDGDLEFVPFELVATHNKGEYLRSVWPLARKLTVKQAHRDPDRPPARKNGLQRILFILSDVEGSLSVVGHTFKGGDAIALARLRHIHEELKQTKEIYGDNVREVILTSDTDNTKVISEAFSGELFDVVQFAGHSVRSDASKDVFLALPGAAGRPIRTYNAEDFARRAAEVGARLVILSSCEGASCRALSRLAASGVPAVAGFRWKVDDRDAALFTPALHKALRQGDRPVPVLRAFHEALRALKEPGQERLTWFSPVLMLQSTDWYEYRVGL